MKDDRHGATAPIPFEKDSHGDGLADARRAANRIGDTITMEAAHEIVEVLAEHARLVDRLDDQIDRLGHEVEALGQKIDSHGNDAEDFRRAALRRPMEAS